MAEFVSTSMRNAILSAIATELASGALRIYQSSGTPPADANAAVNGTLGVDIAIGATPFAAPSGGSMAKNGTWEDTSADATVTPDYGRLVASGDTGGSSTTEDRIQFSVGGPSSGADLELDSATVTAGQTVTISSATVTMPAS